MTCIQTIRDLLPFDLAHALHHDLKQAHFVYGWKSAYEAPSSHWNVDFTQNGGENGLDCSSVLTGVVLEAWNHIKEHHFPNSRLLRCYANAHTFGIEGYPHTDSVRLEDKTIVLYMNKTWKRMWGGETLVYQGNQIIGGELPEFNKALVFPGSSYHVAKAVSRSCPELRITLMFKIAPEGIDQQRDSLQTFLTTLGADKKPHKYGTLLRHLLYTYDILKRLDQEDHVCVAGACHSVMGTGHYHDACLKPSEQQTLIDVIGEPAFELVKLFCQTLRPKELESALSKGTTSVRMISGETRDLSPSIFDNLVTLECANLWDQNSLSEFPKLKLYWDKISRDKYI